MIAKRADDPGLCRTITDRRPSPLNSSAPLECKACGKHFEVSVPIIEHDRLKKRPPKCPKCGKSRVLQLVSSFSTKAPSKY
jgi:putative FmdB family regulatory protein